MEMQTQGPLDSSHHMMGCVAEENQVRAHPDLNQGPADLQSAALPLSYTPSVERAQFVRVTKSEIYAFVFCALIAL